MAELAVLTKDLDFHLEQIQDFTPTPMTVSTEAWYTGYDPYTLEPIFSAKTPKEKLAQRQFFFWYKPEARRDIERELQRIGRSDLIGKLYDNMPKRHPRAVYDPKAIGSSPEVDQHQSSSRPRKQKRGQQFTSRNSSTQSSNKPKSYNPNFRSNRRHKQR